mmetsp:Transcript_26213/g.60515  ORF Transcript_26213/g.60515 Transcript_26213/m.60515 type:complete len:215 (-) Transcript_26213:41-685(-)
MPRADSRSRSHDRGGRGGASLDFNHVQKLVDERQSCRRERDFTRADRLRDELRDMGIQVDDNMLTWRGPKGMDGKVSVGGGGGGGGGPGGVQRRDGDWDCPKCGTMNFANRQECFKCNAPKENGRGGGGGRRRRSPSAGSRSPEPYGGRGGGGAPSRGREEYYEGRGDRRGGEPRREERYDYDVGGRRGGGGGGGRRAEVYSDEEFDDYRRRCQ